MLSAILIGPATAPALKTPLSVISALVSDGIASGDLVVLTPLSGAAEGMRLRVVGVEGSDDGR